MLSIKIHPVLLREIKDAAAAVYTMTIPMAAAGLLALFLVQPGATVVTIQLPAWFTTGIVFMAPLFITAIITLLACIARPDILKPRRVQK